MLQSFRVSRDLGTVSCGDILSQTCVLLKSMTLNSDDMGQ